MGKWHQAGISTPADNNQPGFPPQLNSSTLLSLLQNVQPEVLYLMDPNSPHFCKSRAFPMMWLHFALHNKLCPFRTLVCLFPFFSPFKDFSGRTVSKLSQAALLNAPSLHCRHVAVSQCQSHPTTTVIITIPLWKIHHGFHGPTVDVNCQSCKFINIRAEIDKNSSNQGFTLLGLPGCLLALAASWSF